jgi:hypothetical protein
MIMKNLTDYVLLAGWILLLGVCLGIYALIQGDERAGFACAGVLIGLSCYTLVVYIVDD